MPHWRHLKYSCFKHHLWFNLTLHKFLLYFSQVENELSEFDSTSSPVRYPIWFDKKRKRRSIWWYPRYNSGKDTAEILEVSSSFLSRIKLSQLQNVKVLVKDCLMFHSLKHLKFSVTLENLFCDWLYMEIYHQFDIRQ